MFIILEKSQFDMERKFNSEKLMKSAEKEVDELHKFFEDWFLAKVSDDETSFNRLGSVLDDDFTIIFPSGITVKKEILLKNIKRSFGQWKGNNDLRTIRINNKVAKVLSPEIVLVTYEERQGETLENSKTRISSAIFRYDEKAINDVVWVHLHEVWKHPEL